MLSLFLLPFLPSLFLCLGTTWFINEETAKFFPALISFLRPFSLLWANAKTSAYDAKSTKDFRQRVVLDCPTPFILYFFPFLRYTVYLTIIPICYSISKIFGYNRKIFSFQYSNIGSRYHDYGNWLKHVFGNWNRKICSFTDRIARIFGTSLSFSMLDVADSNTIASRFSSYNTWFGNQDSNG